MAVVVNVWSVVVRLLWLLWLMCGVLWLVWLLWSVLVWLSARHIECIALSVGGQIKGSNQNSDCLLTRDQK